MKIRKPFVTWDEFYGALGGGLGTPAAHTHVKADITDTPWAWADVNTTGSNLTDLATRQHAGLTNVTSDQHHAQDHAAEHEVGGGDLLDLADMVGTTVKLTALTDGYIPYHISDAVGLANSPISISGTELDIAAWLDIRASTGRIELTSTTGTNAAYMDLNNTGGTFRIGKERSTGANLLTGSIAYAGIINSIGNYPLQIGVNNAIAVTILPTGFVGIGTATPTELAQIRKVFDSDAGGELFNALDIFGYDVGAMWGQVGCGITFSLRDNAQAEVKLGAIYVRDEGGGLATADGGLSFHTALGGTLAEQVRISKDGDVNLYANDLTTTGTIAATLFEGNLHWDYITNEPAQYPPEYHYHVGKDIVSLHLVDLDDVEADDIFDVLPTAAIHGEGNYDWFGTWDTTAAANTSAEIVVLAGDDKMLRLTDNSGIGQVTTEIVTDAGHEMLNGVIEFRVRQSVNNMQGYFSLYKGAVRVCAIQLWSDGQIRVVTGVATTDMQAYAANTWYTIRIYYDCISRYVAVFIDNVFKKHQAMVAGADADYVDRIKISTSTPNNGYTFDINNLKVFNLTV